MKKLWEGRFKERTHPVVEEFTASIGYDRRLYSYDIAGSIAHAKMLGHCGIIPPAEAEAIIRGLEEVRREIEAGEFRWDTSLEDIHTHIEMRLVEKLGPVGEKLHTARSRNDQVALDMRLYVRDKLQGLEGMLRELQRALLSLAEGNQGVIMPGYTHLQRAQPVLWAHHLLAYVEMLARDRERLRGTLGRVNVLPLGAGALAGSGLPIDQQYVAELLGFPKVSQNSLDAVSDRDFCLEFLSCVAILMVHLSRLAEELVLWSAAEFGFLELPEDFCTGSSLMPQKRNPDVAELVRGKSGRVFGNLVALLTVMKALPLSYNRDLQEDKEALFDTADTLEVCLGVLLELIPKVRPYQERMQEAAGEGFMAATDLVEYLVEKGVPFRQAHRLVGKLVAYALGWGKEFNQLALEEYQRISPLFGEDVFALLTPEAQVARKCSLGSTNPDAVRQQIELWKREL